MISRYLRSVADAPGTLNRAIADLLSRYAEDSFISQTEVARRSGISQSQISKLFRSERRMSINQLESICEALRVSVVAVVAEARSSDGEDKAPRD